MNDRLTTPKVLRPEFTSKVAAWLREGQTVNLYASAGQGMSRLIDDLQALHPEGVRMVRINMKSCAGSFSGFLQTLADALDLQAAAGDDCRVLINRFLGPKTAEQLWLCLERFDALADARVDGTAVDVQGYDICFLNYLNHLRNQERIGLLICSARPVRTCELYIGGRPVSGSKLEFSRQVPLPTLSHGEIRAELVHTFPALSSQAVALLEDLVAAIFQHRQPAAFLHYLCQQEMIDPTLTREALQRGLKTWQQGFDRQRTPGIDQRIGRLESATRRWADRLGRLLGIGYLWQRLGKKLKITLGSIIAIAFAAWQWGAKIWNFLSALLK